MRRYLSEEKTTELYYLGTDPSTGDVLTLMNVITYGQTAGPARFIRKVDTFMGLSYGDGIRADLYVKVAEAGDLSDLAESFSYTEYLAALESGMTALLSNFVRNIGEDENDAERYLRSFVWD